MSENTAVLVALNEAPLDGDDTDNDEFSITTPFDISKIRIETKTPQMAALIKRIGDDAIDLAPSFQRSGGIWSDAEQSRLIESMLIKIPLPAFYMDATDNDYWLIVDGLQRLTTIKRFVIDQDLVLKGLEFLTDYNGKKFSELPRSFQRRIEETDIVLYLIQPGTPANVKFDIFRRINTGGRPLSAQEIRHALNQGQVTEFLQKLALSELFIKATDAGVSASRMDDRECVLRFLAFSLFSPSGYESNNFDRFLNSAMELANTLKKEELLSFQEKFNSAMQCAIDVFDQDAFRKRYLEDSSRYAVNKALFESWSVNLGLLSHEQQAALVKRKDLVKEKFLDLMNTDKDFETAISQGTGSVKKVRYRFSQIEKLIMDALTC